MMKQFRAIGTTALFLVVAAGATTYAQKDDHKDGGKPAQEQQPKPEQQHAPQSTPAQQQHTQQAQQSRPSQQQHTQQAQQSKPAQQQHTQQAQQSRPAQQQHTQQAQQSSPAQQQHTQQAQQSRPAQQQHTQQAQQSRSGQQQRPERSTDQQTRQRSMPALRLSARGSGRIPDDRFRASFGEGHRFVIREPVMVGGYSRFQYGGFWFGFVQPWPVDWYYTDDVYVDYYDGGYYLCNPYYPGARVSISVVL
jgi:hypothetical protein